MSEIRCKNCQWWDDGRSLCFMMNGLPIEHPKSGESECIAAGILHAQHDDIKMLRDTLEAAYSVIRMNSDTLKMFNSKGKREKFVLLPHELWLKNKGANR